MELARWGYERFGGTGIQTAGNLIDDELIEVFRKFSVGVGISIDGPGDLNAVRSAGSPEKTAKATRRTEEAIDKLCSLGMAPSLIVTIHQGNAGTEEKVDRLVAWLNGLRAKGVSSIRIHVLETESDEIRERLGLSPERNLHVILRLGGEVEGLSVDVVNDIRSALRGDLGCLTCIWKACDPWNTDAVRGVDADGRRINCGRTNKDGANWTKTPDRSYVRQLALYRTPQESGGCKGCRFFVMCQGQCPGTAIDGDWRNRSVDCLTWKALFRHFEDEMLDAGEVPLTAQPERLRGLEAQILSGALDASSGAGGHGDHTDRQHGDHTDRTHGDGEIFETVVPVREAS
ncbi:MAG: hypothetical protein R3253_05180 [Longimicrobiales bacterium]|nr:hypothetical protein [Longimicrobiales bacterium]